MPSGIEAPEQAKCENLALVRANGFWRRREPKARLPGAFDDRWQGSSFQTAKLVDVAGELGAPSPAPAESPSAMTMKFSFAAQTSATDNSIITGVRISTIFT